MKFVLVLIGYAVMGIFLGISTIFVILSSVFGEFQRKMRDENVLIFSSQVLVILKHSENGVPDLPMLSCLRSERL